MPIRTRWVRAPTFTMSGAQTGFGDEVTAGEREPPCPGGARRASRHLQVVRARRVAPFEAQAVPPEAGDDQLDRDDPLDQETILGVEPSRRVRLTTAIDLQGSALGGQRDAAQHHRPLGADAVVRSDHRGAADHACRSCPTGRSRRTADDPRVIARTTRHDDHGARDQRRGAHQRDRDPGPAAACGLLHRGDRQRRRRRAPRRASSTTAVRMRVSRSLIENLPEARASAGKVTADRAVTDLESYGHLRRVEVLPVREDDHGALAQAEPGDGIEDLGPDLGRLDDARLRDPRFAGLPSHRTAVELASLVEHGPVEIRPARRARGPSGRSRDSAGPPRTRHRPRPTARPGPWRTGSGPRRAWRRALPSRGRARLRRCSSFIGCRRPRIRVTPAKISPPPRSIPTAWPNETGTAQPDAGRMWW